MASGFSFSKFSSSPSPFSFASSSSSSPFGFSSSSSSPFGFAAASSFGFGASNPPASAPAPASFGFGSAASPTTGAAPASFGFGSAASRATTGAASSSPLFGTGASSSPFASSGLFSNTPKLFESSTPSSVSTTTATVFGSLTTPNLFGTGTHISVSTPTTLVFGSSTTPNLFGSGTPSSVATPRTTAFGSSITTPNLFGSSTPTSVSTTSTTPLFGSSSSSLVSTPTTPLFGSSVANLAATNATTGTIAPNLSGSSLNSASTTTTAWAAPVPAFGLSSSSSTAASTAASTVASSTPAVTFPSFSTSTTSIAASSATTSSIPSFSLSTKSVAPSSSTQAQSKTTTPLFGIPSSTSAFTTTSSVSATTTQTSTSLTVASTRGYAKMYTRGRGRRGRGTTGRGTTPQGVTTTSVLTPTVQSTPNNPEHHSSAAPHISESVQASEPLTPEEALVTKGRGRTKGLALAKVRGHGEKVKLGFSRTLGRATSENNDDLTMYTTELGVIVRQFAPLQEKNWKAVSQDAKEMCIAHIREKFDLPEVPYVNKGILRAMGRRYCDNRSRLKKKFEKGIVNCPEHIEEADWTYLCDLWQDTVYVGKCNKYKASRSKPRIHHVAGSKAFYKVKNDMKTKKKIANLDLPELWKETHYSKKRKCWTNDSETVYKKLKEVKDQSMENGSIPLVDEELSCTVLGRKPGYIRGLGHGPKSSLTKSGQTSRAQLMRDAEEAREAAAAAERKCEEALAEAAHTRKNTEQLSETLANMQSQIKLLLQLNGRNMPSNDSSEYIPCFLKLYHHLPSWALPLLLLLPCSATVMDHLHVMIF